MLWFVSVFSGVEALALMWMARQLFRIGRDYIRFRAYVTKALSDLSDEE